MIGVACIEEGWHGWDEVQIFGEAGRIEMQRPRKHPLGWGCRIHTQRGAAVERLEAEPVHGDATRGMLAALRTGSAVACEFAGAATSVAVVEAALAAAGDGAWRNLPA